jgi:hypothetical protein
MELPKSVLEEAKEAREQFPTVNIDTVTNSFLIGSYSRTVYTCIKFTLTFPEEYPNKSLIVDVKADSIVPPGLKRKLDTDLTKDVPIGQYQQISCCFSKLVAFVDRNKFLPCWKELKQAVNLIQNDGTGSTISLNESKGQIKLKLCKGKYFYNANIQISDQYPTTSPNEEWGTSCLLTMLSTNFPPKIEVMLTSQAKEVVRRMQDGMSSEAASHISNPVPRPKVEESSNEDVEVCLSRERLKELKTDIETLSRVRELREVDAATKQGDARIKAHNARERKEARRTINKLTQTEKAKDLVSEEQDKQWKLDEQARMANYMSEHDGSNPQPSLFSLIQFLRDKIQYLPDAKCPCCKRLTLPTEPEVLKTLYKSASECKTDKEKKERKKAKAMRPIRTYCGCWYHYECLNKFMTEPPFGIACPTEGCGRRVFHPDWPDDIKTLDRAWSALQARKREIEDISMLF